MRVPGWSAAESGRRRSPFISFSVQLFHAPKPELENESLATAFRPTARTYRHFRRPLPNSFSRSRDVPTHTHD
jgi:hypothetical protein